MSREEAKQWILEHMPPDDDTKQSQVMAVVIKALSQEPCDTYTEGYFKGYDDGLEQKLEEPCTDAVSREAVKEIINDIRDCISVEGYCAILERLKKLPPVTQRLS